MSIGFVKGFFFLIFSIYEREGALSDPFLSILVFDIFENTKLNFCPTFRIFFFTDRSECSMNLIGWCSM